ncbi:MAG: ADP-ribosylglycohydrolase family protein [Deltaproteobacteria bacterium]|nr:ADP-ribosylglycohydrolase family protein [Deltaproteobacteria bacterium]
MRERTRGMVFGSFVGDSLALGVHWIYRTADIDEGVGRANYLRAPDKDSFHAGKKAGEFTHYGDQALTLLESVAKNQGFDLERWADDWRALFANYRGYMDRATKATLENFAQGKSPEEAGSHVEELAGASRMAPVIYRHRTRPDLCERFCVQQTAMTHNTALVKEVAGFLCRVTMLVLGGEKPTAALLALQREGGHSDELLHWLERGLETRGRNTRYVIKGFGQSCEVRYAFPSLVHLMCSYENDLAEGLVQNNMAGGDSAARGMALGMVLGAHLGMPAVPEEWVYGLAAKNHIESLLGYLDEGLPPPLEGRSTLGPGKAPP